jgi:hypothetical protein
MKKLINIGLVFSLLLYASSCGDDFLDVNVDPNNPSDAPVNLVFPAAVGSTASVVGGWYAILGGLWSQHWTQNNTSNQYKDFDSYNIQPTDLDFSFQETYSGALNDYNFVRKKAMATQDWNFYLMATIMQAYTFQNLVDLYDQIPFNNALQGNEGNINPTYLAGEAVYDSLIVRIDEALAKDLTVRTSTDPGNADIVFQGDMEQWVRFANTLKLKIYLRQVYARPQVAEAGIKALYTSGAEFLTEAAAVGIFQDQPSKSNPLFESDQRQLNTTNNLKASTTLFSFLQTRNDPRLDAYFIAPATGHKSLDQGNFEAPTSVIPANTLSGVRINATDPVYFISTAESYFLQAEAVLRGWGTGDAKALYDSGVAAAFEQEGLNGTTFYGAGGAYEFPVAGNQEQKLEAIIVQKWVALAGTFQGIESFFEQNRTGYPRISPVPASNAAYIPGQLTYSVEGVTPGQQFPRRLLFTDTERSRNPNTPAQVPITEAVWWDKN